jgi:hypothetical protein
VLTNVANESQPNGVGKKQAVASAPGPTPGIESNATIEARCASRWKANAEMQAFCRDQQREALSALQQRSMTTAEQRGIRLKCRADWPDDFHMQKYCEDERLKTPSRSSM